MDALPFVVGFVAGHVYLAVFVANTIDATGIPFPGRIVLILAGAFLQSKFQLVFAIIAGATGALLGDHLLYLAGQRGGPALLAFYCRLTLGSERCVDDTVKYFRRFGPSAILLGRYSTGIRLFAAILSGCGHLRYRRFLRYDIAGSLVYATLWVTVGYLFGDHVSAVLAWLARRRAVVLIFPAAVLAIVAYRLWRRWRYAPARAGLVPDQVCHTNVSGRRIDEA
jgi:membrane protein DedA with SNARE-associated domain